MGMIVSIPEFQVALGLAASITDADRGLLSLLQPKAQAAVIEKLGYDPVQREATEFYPRAEIASIAALADDSGRFEVSGSRAVWAAAATSDYLQLARLPVRSVAHVYVDNDGRFGQRAGAFGAGTELTAGEDYYLELDEEGLCRTGCLIAATGWPVTPGSIKVTYTAGYSDEEFTGRADSGINAAAIAEAILLTTIHAFRAYKAQQKGRAGFVAGAITSERLGDYSYTADGASAAAMSALAVNVPPAALEKLETFINYGRQLA